MLSHGGWAANDKGAITKNYEFKDFHQASNFMLRFTEYCTKVNMIPQWSNVYNRVSVSLHNKEFSGVTEKEVKVANYLDTISKIDIDLDVNDILSLD